MNQLVQAIKEDRTEWHLSNWAAWQRNSGVSLWYPSRASGGMGKTGSSDFDAMCATADSVSAAAVEALINDLARPEQIAVHHVWLGSVFRVRGDLVALYESAKANITRGLEIRGIW